MNKRFILPFIVIISSVLIPSCQKTNQEDDDKDKIMKALIIDGQNNHGIWPKTTMMLKDYLEETGLFKVDVERTASTWQGPHNDNDIGFNEAQRLKLLENFPIAGNKTFSMVTEPVPDPGFKPDFSQYDVVISNFGWRAADWPDDTRSALEMYVSGGGGLVIIHAASNSFGEWGEFNRMAGLGGWGDRSEKNGPYVYYDNNNVLVRDTTVGEAGSHGKQYEFLITVRDTLHPITQGMPTQWLHVQDELYDRLRGPAENMNVLATAYSDEVKNDSPFSDFSGTNRHEPMVFTVNYGNGRVFHTPLGHAAYSMECVGFISLIQRGAEWAATGKVTQTTLPADFPTAEKVSQRKWEKSPQQ